MLRRLLLNYTGQLYSIAAGLILLPIFYRQLGPASVGLIGLYTTFQTCMTLLDTGLTPSFSRETTRFSANILSRESYVQFMSSIEVVFLIIFSTIFVGAITISIYPVSSLLVRYQEYIILFGLILGFRWLTTLYRAGLIGREKVSEINSILVFTTTNKYVLGLILVLYANFGIKEYFWWQTQAAVLEFLLTYILFKRKFVEWTPKLRFFMHEIKPRIRLAAGITFSSSIWLGMTQLDKFIFASRLSVDQFGAYTMIYSISNGVLLLSSPLLMVLQPYYSRLYATEDFSGLFKSFQLTLLAMSFATASLIGIFYLFYDILVSVWFADNIILSATKGIFFGLLIGNIFTVFASTLYALQIASGVIRINVVASWIGLLFEIPIIVYLCSFFAPEYFAFYWAIARTFSFLIIYIFMSNYFTKTSYLHSRWALLMVQALAFPAILCILIISIRLAAK